MTTPDPQTERVGAVADAVVDALEQHIVNALEPSYADGFARGVVEGRRQATEGAVDRTTLAAIICATRDDAVHRVLAEDHVCGDCKEIAKEVGQRLVSRLVGPWEPDGPTCTCPMPDVTNIREHGEGIRTLMKGLDPACPVCVRANAEQTTVRLDNRDATYAPADPSVPLFEGDDALPHPVEAAIVEHGIRMSGGGHHIRLDHPEIERIFSLADWIRANQMGGGKVDTRRVIVVDDWTEVPRAEQDGDGR